MHARNGGAWGPAWWDTQGGTRDGTRVVRRREVVGILTRDQCSRVCGVDGGGLPGDEALKVCDGNAHGETRDGRRGHPPHVTVGRAPLRKDFQTFARVLDVATSIGGKRYRSSPNRSLSPKIGFKY